MFAGSPAGMAESTTRRHRGIQNMATRGLYVQRLDSGEIHTVQVDDGVGNQYPMEPGVYITRGYLPPIEALPNIDDYVSKP